MLLTVFLKNNKGRIKKNVHVTVEKLKIWTVGIFNVICKVVPQIPLSQGRINTPNHTTELVP